MRMLIDEIEQALAIQHQHLRIFTRDRRSRSGSAVEKRELADHVSLLDFREDKLLAFGAFHKKLNLAGAKNKELAAVIAVMEDGFARLEFTAAHHLRQRFALFVIEQAKDRNFSDHRHCG